MTQQRTFDYGALLTQRRVNLRPSKTISPGIYEGMTARVDGADLVLSPGTFMMPNGILVHETADIRIPITVPGGAANFTVVAEHDDIQASGGSPVLYGVRPGLLDRAPAGALSLAWIRFQSSAPLALAMVSQPHVRNSAAPPLVLGGAFAERCSVEAGSNIIASTAMEVAPHLGLKLENTAASGALPYKFRFPIPPHVKVRRIDVFGIIPSGGSISFNTSPYQCLLTDGAAIGTSAPLTGAATGLSSPIGQVIMDNYPLDNPPAVVGVTIMIPAQAFVFLTKLALIED